jgi:hypothetical protein
VTDTYPPSKQRPALLAFAAACGTRADKLRRDDCGDWAIWGRNGHIHAVPEGYQLVVIKSSVTGWTYAKRRLAFGTLAQDGDEEGAVILAELPTPEQAKEIRFVIGIAQRRELSAERREIVSAKGRENLKRHNAQRKIKPVLLAFEGD